MALISIGVPLEVIRIPLKIYKIIQSSKIRITKLVRNKEVKTDVYKGPCQTFTRECFAKVVIC